MAKRWQACGNETNIQREAQRKGGEETPGNMLGPGTVISEPCHTHPSYELVLEGNPSVFKKNNNPSLELVHYNQSLLQV